MHPLKFVIVVFKLMLFRFFCCAPRDTSDVSMVHAADIFRIQVYIYIYLTHQPTRFNLENGGSMYLRNFGNIQQCDNPTKKINYQYLIAVKA
jgi:hypothetical protein